MSDPVLALILIVAFFAVVTAASYFKTLDTGFWSDAGVPLIAGVICGVLIRFVQFVPYFVVTGILLTLAALYVRLVGRESEPSDGMTVGAVTGAAAAVPLALFGGERELLLVASCILAGAVAGFGITFGLSHVRDSLRQAGVDAATAALAIGAAWLPSMLLRTGAPRITERHIAIGSAAVVPLLILITVFKQWPSVRSELRHEAALGFIDDEGMALAARYCDVSVAHVQGVVTFYTHYKRPFHGKHRFMVCATLMCAMGGHSDRALAQIEARLGLKPGERTSDGLFSLEKVECLADCHLPPVVQVDFEHCTKLEGPALEARLDALLQQEGKRGDHYAGKSGVAMNARVPVQPVQANLVQLRSAGATAKE